MTVKIDSKDVAMSNHEILRFLQSALGIDGGWFMQDGRVMEDYNPEDEHSSVVPTGYDVEVFKAFQAVKKALLERK